MVLLFSLTAGSRAEQLDTLAFQAFNPSQVATRWDNLEGPPQWVCGCKPSFARECGLHLVQLLPSESVTFLVPPRSVVRVMAPGQRLNPDDVELWISNGTGLYRRQLSAVSTCDTSLIAAPDEAHTSLARVVRPHGCGCAVAVAVFTSRLDVPQVVDGYRHQVDGCGPQITVREADETGKQQFYCLQPGRPARFSVSGPARLAIETRLRYPPTESRMFQAYQLGVQGNGRLRKVLEYETSSELRQRVLVEDHEEVLGRRETAYLDIPLGDHQLHLDATASLLVRIGSTHRRDYLLPTLNRPYKPTTWPQPATELPVAGQAVPPALPSEVSLWNLQPQRLHDSILGAPWCLTDHETIALRSARDNRYREGGLHSMMLMRAAAASRPDYGEIRAVADKLRGFHTFFRDLLPSETVDGARQRVAWFHTRRLRNPAEPAPDVILAEQHIEDAVDGLSRAHFLTVPEGRDAAHRFRLPADLGTSLLRLVVDRSSLTAPTRILLQFDDRVPVQLYALGSNELPPSEFVPTRAEAALAAQGWQHGVYDAGTLGGPFAVARNPADLVNVGTNELIVPAEVRDVRIWTESPRSASVSLALQYRASRPYRLSESQYLELFRRTGADYQLFATALQDAQTDRSDSPVRQELQNHWLPFVRFVRAQHRLFTAGVDRAATRSAVSESLPEPQRQRLFDEAVRLADRRSWLPALEAWSQVLPHLEGSRRRTALLARADALDKLEEVFLAEREWRAMCLYDADPRVRQEAWEKLRQFHQRRVDIAAEEQLLAAAVVCEPTYQRLAELAASLLENGHYEYALMAALAVPDRQRPVPVVVRAAYKMRWWQVFHDAVSQLSEPQQRHYWLAQRNLTAGDYTAACSHFAKAGRRGAIAARHLRGGQRIHAMLCHPSAVTRARGVLAWEQWQAGHPGPTSWREEGSLVDSYAGTAAVYSINRDTYAQYYKAQTDRPLSLRVLGPVRLKFEARPTLQQGDEIAPDDILSVRAPGRQYLFPINGSRPSTGLQIVGDPHHVPGRAVNAEVDLGPGLHEIEVAAEKSDLLVRVFAQRPEIPLPVLPPLHRDALDAVLVGRYGTMIHCGQRAHVRLLLSCGERPVNQLLVSQIAACQRCSDQCCVDLGGLLAARLALRTGHALSPDVVLDWATSVEAGSHREQMLALARLPETFGMRRALSAGEWQLPSAEQQAAFAAVGDYQSALDVAHDNDPDALRQRMGVLVKLAESDDRERLRATVLGNELATRYRNLPSLAQAVSRLTQFATWKPYREVMFSNGLHGKSIQGWLPESPGLRVRKAMLSNVRPGDNLLAGYQHLVLAMQNPRPTRLQLTLSQGQLSSLPASAQTVQWQLDEDPSQRIELLSAGSAESLQVDVPQGAHRLRLWLDQPLANQYVVVGVCETSTMDLGFAASETTQLMRHTERLYHVASQDHPVQFRIDGPAWVRIDQLLDDTTQCHYVTVPEGGKLFELQPPDDTDSALFRIFEYRLDRNLKVPPTATVNVLPEPLPAPLIDGPDAEDIGPGSVTSESWLHDIPDAWGEPLAPLSLLSPDAAPRPVELYDPLPLGGQEDGTWSLGMDLVSRRALDEFPNSAAPGRFVEWNATHRFYDQWRQSYKKTELLLRLRERSGPTFGLRHGSWHEPNHLPFNVGWKGFAYFQRPSDAIPPAKERTEWSFGASGRIWEYCELSPDWHHVPSLYVFGRWLSRERPAYQPGRVDQDIFTQYKADHPTGMRLWDTFVFTPWLDARWWLRPALVTNEDYDPTRPDHIYLRVGRSQLAGPLIIDASYRLAEFYDDEDRADNSLQHLLALEGLAKHFTVCGRHCELDIRVVHDLSSGKTSAGLSLATYFDNGRQHRDMYPGDERFLALRKQQALNRVAQPGWPNN